MHHLCGVEGSLAVEGDAGTRLDLLACRDTKLRVDAVADIALPAAVGIVGRQQTAGGIGEHLARQRVDRLQHPRGDRGVRVDGCRYPQDVAP